MTPTFVEGAVTACTNGAVSTFTLKNSIAMSASQYPGWSPSGDLAYPWQQAAQDGFTWKTRACSVCGGPVVSSQVDPVAVPHTSSWSGVQHVSYKLAWTCVAGHKTWAYPGLGPVAVKASPSVSRLRPDGQLELV